MTPCTKAEVRQVLGQQSFVLVLSSGQVSLGDKRGVAAALEALQRFSATGQADGVTLFAPLPDDPMVNCTTAETLAVELGQPVTRRSIARAVSNGRIWGVRYAARRNNAKEAVFPRSAFLDWLLNPELRRHGPKPDYNGLSVDVIVAGVERDYPKAKPDEKSRIVRGRLAMAGYNKKG